MIYFASDIHLGSGSPEVARRTERAFCRWLDMVAHDATEIYLLGDIFDFWFEYRRVVPQGFVRTLGRLAALADRGVRIILYTGNHDMWCYDYLTRECSITIVNAPQVVSVGSRRLHLAHGDNMNISGQPMLRLMNTIFRSRVARWLFRWLIHPDLALKFGAWWSGKSRKKHGGERITPDKLGYLIEYARKHRTAAQDVEAYIFGHMHLTHRHQEDGGLDVLFMSDWSAEEASYVALDNDGTLTIKTFVIDEAVS